MIEKAIRYTFIMYFY